MKGRVNHLNQTKSIIAQNFFVTIVLFMPQTEKPCTDFIVKNQQNRPYKFAEVENKLITQHMTLTKTCRSHLTLKSKEKNRKIYCI